MSTPLFSIVIPTYNRGDLVRYAIQSVLKQTFGDFEIVVSDNCSTDDTPEVVTGFTDPRLRYVRPPRHLVIADNWEFARSKATGKLILMLGDDDALVTTALERFAAESSDHNADFLFCRIAEYRDLGFPGPARNTLRCPPFSGSSRIIDVDEFLRPLFSFRSKFSMHPSAFVFAQTIVDRVVSRCGRFFQTNGVEYCAWPLAAVFANTILYIDAPLCICGRTGKSGGSYLRLGNPGKKLIQEFIADFEQKHEHAPLANFTYINLWAEGVLTAKARLPREFAEYEFDEAQYLRSTMMELVDRKSMGVDVRREIKKLLSYSEKYPLLMKELTLEASGKKTLWGRTRSTIGDLGARGLRDRIRNYQQNRKVKRGEVRSGFAVSGADFGFYDILECAEFLRRVVVPAPA